MNTAEHIPNLSAIVDRIAATLGEEIVEIGRVNAILEEQMDLLRERAYDQIEAHTQRLNDAVHAASLARAAHGRQTALLGRMLQLGPETTTLLAVIDRLSSSDTTRAQAARLQVLRLRLRALLLTAGQRVAAFEFALGYASRVGRDLLSALHQLMQPPSKNVYTAGGLTLRTHTGRPLLNRVG